MTDQGYLEQPDIHVKAPFRAALLTQPGNLREALRQAVEDPSKTLFGVGHGIPSTFVTKVGARNLNVPCFILIRYSPVDCIYKARLHMDRRRAWHVQSPDTS
jgi:hypothetical protein